MSSRYQTGSLRRETRARGSHVWVWRYRVKGVMMQEKFACVDFPTEKAVWKHLQTPIALLNEGSAKPLPAAVTLATVIGRYEKEIIPGLAKSTRNTDGSMLRVHVTPKWNDIPVADIRPMAVDTWIRSLVNDKGKPLSTASMGRSRRMMKQLIDKAMFWEYIPIGVNPMTLVKVKGVTKREKPIVLLTIKQVVSLSRALRMPYSLMVRIAAMFGLRVSEAVALKWDDFDFKAKTVTISRAYTHGELKEVKTEASKATLPVEEELIAELEAYRKGDSEWVFPSPRTKGPYSGDTILAKHIQPAAQKLKLPHIGWHTFRHSYRSWLGGSKGTMIQLKDLMRHSDIATMADVYGGKTPVNKMRPLTKGIAKQFQTKPVPSKP